MRLIDDGSSNVAIVVPIVRENAYGASATAPNKHADASPIEAPLKNIKVPYKAYDNRTDILIVEEDHKGRQQEYAAGVSAHMALLCGP